jgi:hypothetical protein
MNRWKQLRSHLPSKRPDPGALNPLRYLGPGLLVAIIVILLNLHLFASMIHGG